MSSFTAGLDFGAWQHQPHQPLNQHQQQLEQIEQRLSPTPIANDFDMFDLNTGIGAGFHTVGHDNSPTSLNTPLATAAVAAAAAAAAASAAANSSTSTSSSSRMPRISRTPRASTTIRTTESSVDIQQQEDAMRRQEMQLRLRLGMVAPTPTSMRNGMPKQTYNTNTLNFDDNDDLVCTPITTPKTSSATAPPKFEPSNEAFELGSTVFTKLSTRRSSYALYRDALDDVSGLQNSQPSQFDSTFNDGFTDLNATSTSVSNRNTESTNSCLSGVQSLYSNVAANAFNSSSCNNAVGSNFLGTFVNGLGSSTKKLNFHGPDLPASAASAASLSGTDASSRTKSIGSTNAPGTPARIPVVGLPSSHLAKAAASRAQSSAAADTSANKVTKSRKRKCRPSTAGGRGNSWAKRCKDHEEELRKQQSMEFLKLIKECNRSSSSSGSEELMKCPFPGCHRTFAWEWALNEHKATHENEKGRTHICKYCNKGFFSANSLRAHTKIHTREAQLLCLQGSRMHQKVFHLGGPSPAHPQPPPSRQKVEMPGSWLHEEIRQTVGPPPPHH